MRGRFLEVNDWVIDDCRRVSLCVGGVQSACPFVFLKIKKQKKLKKYLEVKEKLLHLQPVSEMRLLRRLKRETEVH